MNTEIFTPELLQELDLQLEFNYQKLCGYIQKFLKRTDESTIRNIPTFIALAEQRLAVDLKFLPGVQVNQFQIPASSSSPQSLPYTTIVQKPNQWRETKSMSFVNTMGRSYIYPRSLEYLQNYMNDFNDTTLVDFNNFTDMVFYSDYDNYNWIIGPYKADMAYTLEVLYFSTIPTLNSTNQTNYWTQLAPRALLYAAFYEASYYLRSDDRTLNSWASNYTECVKNLGAQNVSSFSENAIQRTN